MTHHYIITAVGANITGIVAQVSREIFNCGCNFEDSRMMFLGTHFSLMILVTGEQEGMYQKLQDACRRLREEQDLSVTVFKRDAIDDETDAPTRPDCEIQIKGRDRMGIVYRTSQLLAALDVNIIEMETSVDYSEDVDASEFSMRIIAAAPSNLDVETLGRKFNALAEEIDETVSFSSLNHKQS